MKFNLQKPLFYGLSSVLLVTACKTDTKKEVAEAQTDPGINLSYMDTTTSPKDDFFRYVNGTWLDQTTIPDDKTVWGSFNELRDCCLRSEEHTSELQSRENLVCRLLLEKKKTKLLMTTTRPGYSRATKY